MSRSVETRDGRFALTLWWGGERRGKMVTVEDRRQRAEGELTLHEAQALRAGLVELLIGELVVASAPPSDGHCACGHVLDVSTDKMCRHCARGRR